jgi:hypothetical protein
VRDGHAARVTGKLKERSEPMQTDELNAQQLDECVARAEQLLEAAAERIFSAERSEAF